LDTGACLTTNAALAEPSPLTSPTGRRGLLERLGIERDAGRRDLFRLLRLALQPRRADEPSLDPDHDRPDSFDEMMRRWFPLTYVLNNLNRGLGLPDGYPFVLSAPAIDKLRFVHETVRAA